MTNQELFNKCATHLLTQNAKSQVDPNPGDNTHEPVCMYRGPGGLKCALGVLIPDMLYRSNLEGEGLSTICKLAGIRPEQLELAILLQNTHDLYAPSQWPRVLRALAERYDLNPSVLEP